jgi:hypothetical membrane protein
MRLEKSSQSEDPYRRDSYGRGLLIGALCWILCLEWFVGQAIAQAAWTTHYSMLKNYISDLGAVHCQYLTIVVNPNYTYHQYVCSPLYTVLDGSSILLGLLIVLGVILLRPIWPPMRLTTIGFTLVALYGVGRIIVGIFPEDVNLKLHVVGSAGFLLGNIGSVLIGLSCWKALGWKAIVFVGIGIIGTLSFVLLLEAPQLGIGLLERLASYPLTLWLVVLGIDIILSRRIVRSKAVMN